MSGRRESMGVLVVLAGFAALCVWIVLRLSNSEPNYPPASSYSPNPDGVKALYQLLAQTGQRAERFGDTEYEYPAQSCVVLIEESPVDASQMMSGQVDVKALAVWLKQGGRLVLAGAPSSSHYSPLEPTAQSLIDYLDGNPAPGGGLVRSAPTRGSTQAASGLNSAGAAGRG